MRALIVFATTILVFHFDSSKAQSNEEADPLQRTPSQIVMDSVSDAGMFQ